MTDERGASEVIGFVLIVSLVLLTTSVVFVSGFTGLEDTRDAERVRNAERAFDVLDDNMGDIAYRNAPARATEIKLDDAQLSLAATTDITVEATDSAGTTETMTRQIRPIVFTSKDGSQVVYEAGAVIRQSRDGATMNSEPGLVFDQQRTVLNLIETSSSSRSSVGGSATVLVRAERDISSTDDPERTQVVYTQDANPPIDVTLEIDTVPQRTGAWKRYVERKLSENGMTGSCSVSTDTVTCTFETQSIRAGSSVIDVEVEA